VRKAGRGRQTAVTIRAGRQTPRGGQARTRPAPSPASSDTVPLEHRSLVATHPLVPDPITTAAHPVFAGDLVPGAEGAAPRCRGAHPNGFALAGANLGRDLVASKPAMVEGEWPHCRGATHPQSSWHLASLGSAVPPPDQRTSSIESGWPIHWRASASCLAAPLRDVLALVAAEFGQLTVNSTCRSPAHNARVGGAPRSYHLGGNAVDFRVRSHFDEVLRFLARMRSVGGLTHYGSGVFHIDSGPRRTWGPNSWGRSRGGRVRRRA
jgi:Peptidase M15